MLLLVRYGGRPECLRETGAAAGGGGVGDAGGAGVGCSDGVSDVFRETSSGLAAGGAG